MFGLGIGRLGAGAYQAVGAAPPAPWTPAEISTALWLDAADASTIILNGSNVSQWSDKSGNNRHATQATASAQPVYVANGLNGLGGLSSIGNRHIGGNLPFTGNAWTAFAVATMNSTSAEWARLLSVGVMGVADFNNVSSASFILRNQSFEQVTSYREGALLSTRAITYGAPFIVSSRYTGTQQITGVDGTQAAGVNSSGNFGTQNYGVFRDTQSLSQWIGAAYEMLVVTGAMPVETRQRIEGYLAHKWGLTANLPSDHPYKTEAPTV